MNPPDTAPPTTFRDIPSVDSLLNHSAIGNLLDEFPRSELLSAIRLVLDDRRAALRDGCGAALDLPSLALDVRQKLYQRARPSLRRVINATGIVLHTGLGRAPLAEEALAAITEVAAGYSNLELDLANGERGDRHAHVRELLREVTGAPDALVVNNNAAATCLALHALAAGGAALVSRGELVEIGGSYRLPEIMAAAGCRMVEVGTTNRTRIADFERALTGDTRVLLRVHTSNYRIVGFQEAATLAELVALARRCGTPHPLVVDDLGSGLIDARLFERDRGAAPATAAAPVRWDEPTVRDSLAAGADVVLFSGDKLLGGPQAGVILGAPELLSRMRASPLMRTFRPDKLTFAALEATLRLYRDPAALVRRLPIFRMLLAPLAQLERTARALAEKLQRLGGSVQIVVAADESLAGGGSLPTQPFPTWVVRVRWPDRPGETLVAALRAADVPIICRLHDDWLTFDARTIANDELDLIAAALAAANS